MVVIEKKESNRQIEFMEMPEILTPQNVCFYSHHAKEVKGTIKSKAVLFLKGKCITWDPDMACFFCNPIKNYNKSRYKVSKGNDGEFHCDCQFNSRVGLMCSHILAVYLWLKINNHKKETFINKSVCV